MGKKILIVDDDEKLNHQVKEYLEDYGFDVTTLPDGRTLMDILGAKCPDIVLLDLMLPDRDGLELLREIRGAGDTPVIILTARGEDADRIVGLELGADDYLPKPFNPRELLARIKAVMRRRPPEPAPPQAEDKSSDGTGLQRKLKAILSADVKEFSRHMAEDELATIHTLHDYRDLLSACISDYKGRVVDSTGDNLLAEFDSVVVAVRCAVAAQEALKTRNDFLPCGKRMHFRMGINLGDVILEEGRIYGDGVNIAARIEEIADPGGICVSGNVFDQVENKLPVQFESLGERQLKNIPKPVRVYRLRP